jgi:hypothetical protein
MTTRWKRLGRVIDPERQTSWMRSHAALPTVLSIDGQNVTVLCAGRDDQGRSQIGRVSFHAETRSLTAISQEPVLGYGALGTFDDRGALPSCIVKTPSGFHLYYTGVMLGKTVPFYFAVGLAASDDGERWQRVSEAPILERNATDPYLTASPCVLFDGGRYRMWYVSATKWVVEGGETKHYYHIRYAESPDGISWDRRGVVAIDFKPGEYAIARPCVVRDDDRYRMWFPYRGDHYRIGYAESTDGILWQRQDAAFAFDGEPGEWESEMQCYPWIFETGDSRYMAYNGNGYGATGFGLARME